MQKVFQTDITFEFVSLSFGVLPSENVSYNDKYIFQSLNAACRKAIDKEVAKPKKKKTTVKEWIDITFKMETFAIFNFSIRHQQVLFLEEKK